MTTQDDQVLDLALKLLMTTGDATRRVRYWQDAMEAIKPREREFFTGRMLGGILTSFDSVIASHPQGGLIVTNLRAKSDANDFRALTEHLDTKEK